MTEEIIARLRSLDLSGGSHSRLSAIASCFYQPSQPSFGWTRGACEILRDKLIDILEGKDGNDANDNSDGCNRNHHCCDQHQVSYDELGNEWHKAVCRLRNMQMDTGNAIKKLAVALGLEWNSNNAPKSVALLQSRIIHLLGGDEPNFTEIAKTINLGDKSDGELMENGENHKFDGCITDELRKFKGHINAGLTPEMVLALRAEINHIADHIDERARLGAIKADIWQDYANQMRAERDNLLDLLRDARKEYMRLRTENQIMLEDMRRRQAKLDESEHERDELRRSLRQITERAGVPHDRDLSEYGDGQIVKAVIGQLGETKQYVESLEWVRDRRLPRIEAERDELQEKCDRLKVKVEHQREQLAVYATTYDFDAIRALKRERNGHKHRADNAEGHVKSLERRLDAAHETYCALLNDAAREFRALTEERDELQASLRKIAERAGVPHDSEFDEYSDETVIGATLAQIDSTHGYVGALEWQRDRQKKMLDDYDKTHVALPKDANGEQVSIGDMVHDSEEGYDFHVDGFMLWGNTTEWWAFQDQAVQQKLKRCSIVKPPTVEQVIRDLTLGKITESQAIERIEVIHG